MTQAEQAAYRRRCAQSGADAEAAADLLAAEIERRADPTEVLCTAIRSKFRQAAWSAA